MTPIARLGQISSRCSALCAVGASFPLRMRLTETKPEAPRYDCSVAGQSHVLASSQPRSRLRKTTQRLDDACCEQFPEFSRAAIQSWITQGKVLVNEQALTKAGTPVKPGVEIRITAVQDRFVCRAGHKLEAALDHFGIDVTGKHVLDAGISTGGFTDCLLQRGAAHVVGVDVGYGQVAERVRTDCRVTIFERTNVRHLRQAQLPGQRRVDMATLDLSFISLLKVLPAVDGLLTPDAAVVTLIKPQFEAERHQVEPGGIVRDASVHEEVIRRVTSGVTGLGFQANGCIASPIQGAAAGNTEFLAYFSR